MYQRSRKEVALLSLLLALTASPAVAGEPVRGATPVRAEPPTLHAPSDYRSPTVRTLPPAQDPLEWHVGPSVLQGDRPGDLEIVLDVPPGFVVYRDQLAVEVVDEADLQVGHPDIPPGQVRLIPGRDEVPREQYDTDVIVRIPAQARQADPGLRTVHVRVRHQGCFEGHCYRPREQVIPVHVPVRDGTGHRIPEPQVCPTLDPEGNPIDTSSGGGSPVSDEPDGGASRDGVPAPYVVVFYQ